MTAVQKVDLNLFRLLDALYEERSVSRTAERLFITPSAVSHALRRLRHLLGDELFVRGSRGMVPTPRAHEVARQLKQLLPQLYDVITAQHFDPRLTERVFAISCLPYLTTVLMPELVIDFAQAAPHSRMDITMLYSNVVDDLDSGVLDVALGNFRRTPRRLIAEDLLRDDYVWVLRRNHPYAGRKMTLKLLREIPHVDLAIGGTVANAIDSYDVRQGLERLVNQNSMGATESAFAAAGLERDVPYSAPGADAGMAIVARTDATCLVPRRIADARAAGLELEQFEPPYPSPPLVVQMLYHADFAERPAVAWLLDRIRQTAQRLS